MSLITINNLSLSFSGKRLFNSIGFQIGREDRIGLVGSNGTGKTTLLRILVGKVFPDQGDIYTTSGIRMGYLPQDISKVSQGALLASVLDSIPGKIERDTQLKKLERDLDREKDPERQTVLARNMANLYDEINYHNTRYSSHRAEKILLGLGFSLESFEVPLKELSGGWKMRAVLAGLLFQEPDILLLDEPTNHLDFPSVLWLEEFLLNFKNSLILICHDRKFLNRQINRVISLEQEGLRTYTGNYDAYLAAREEEERILQAEARNQEQRVREAKRFIERFRAKSTKARQAQSKIKVLKKIEIVETHKKERVMRFSFPEVQRSGDIAFSIRGITRSFTDKTLYKDLNLYVRRGERIAIIGRNGVGKTTLLRMIAGELSPDTGTIDLGHNVTMSYYAQHHTEFLDEKKTVLEEVYKVVPDAGMSFVRGVCGAFLFSGDEVEKRISVLSGGERARVALARILVKPGNLIVMDEPTNHLDLLSCEVLIKALEEYNGTLIFVSHNQELINRLATRIWDISDGKVEDYPGNLEEYIGHINYLKKTQEQEISEEDSMKQVPSGRQNNNKESAKSRRRRDAERRNLMYRELSPIKKELMEIEQRIDSLEKQEKTLSEQLANPKIYENIKESGPLMAEYGQVKKKLEQMLERWETQQEILEMVETKFQSDLNVK
ncbi:MAG: ABC-F family ATP-binding cassette domain-containing protein [Thermodesulfobacteriota bacterium]|nr:ABC-F family ATP-binding cassette domain-containing protein [Thermodesulfobacteriota bacterium]